MRQIISALLATAPIAIAGQNVFSVHDDLLAFPQYEVVFSDSFIADTEAKSIIEQASSASTAQSQSSDTKSIASQRHSPPTPNAEYAFDPVRETYEVLYLHNEPHLCTIPIVDTPLRNETSEAEARAAEQKEVARATNRGWELLQDLEGNCLYFVSGWWSYSFCYNSEITQFHQLTPKPGQPLLPPKRDPDTKSYTLGRAKGRPSRHDEWGNEVEIRKGKKIEPPKTELQVKGDTRYLVQKMEGGTTCDLTGKPRRVEVQYHCNPHVTDRIGYIKEVTTCSYLMVVYTPRLCNDVAFLPPKDNKAHTIVCRVIVPDDELSLRTELKTLEEEERAEEPKALLPNVGGVLVGGGKWVNKEGARMPVPQNFGKEAEGRISEVIARAKSKADGGQVEILTDAELQKMDLDPGVVENLKKEVQKMAKERGWKIEVVDAPGEVREILGIVDDADGVKEDGDAAEETEASSEEAPSEGSEETFKDEL